ncbi:MAG: TlpA family protein disulfide reductase [Ruminococcaceae bacterium]|jgi:thiol-disulfide isomerase/thioredoxin|nr:TlpA family protein disulfide reductase [Oscillospiraceae bacterium]
MMKKALSLFLALCLTAGMLAGCAKTEVPAPEAQNAAPAPVEAPAATSADTPAPVSAAAEELVSYEEVGVDIPAAADKPEVMGGTLWQAYGSINYSPNVYLLELLYFAMPKEEYEESFQKYTDGTIEEADKERLLSCYGTVGYLMASDGTIEDSREVLGDDPVTTEELGAADGYTFWFVTYPEDDETYLADVDTEFAEDFRKLQSTLPALLKESRFYTPVDPALALAGQTVRFETTDLDGNPVSSEELFAQNEITMINCWATWCGPCKGELAELAELHNRMRSKGCGLIGIVTDGSEAAEEAKSLIAENGIVYPNVAESDDMSSFMDAVSSIPTSLFVDKTGKILTNPIVGANVDAYEPTFDALLAGGAPGASEASAAAGVYRIFVIDADGKAVKGVQVQFCSDTDCRAATTDEAGLASFEAAPAVYTVHILKVPEGYAKDDTEYQTSDTCGDLTVILQKG